MKPTLLQYPEYMDTYISLVKEDNVRDALAETKKTFLAFIGSINPDLENHRYAAGKWSIKEVILHCADTERIFASRALGYARGEKQKSLSFDENTYANNSHADTRSLKDIIDEYETIANATASLFHSFSDSVLSIPGEMPSGPCTVNAVGFAISGHNLHHMKIIKERYL